MPDQKLVNLCAQISREEDPTKLSSLLDQLIQLLNNEEDAIRAKIAQRVKLDDPT